MTIEMTGPEWLRDRLNGADVLDATPLQGWQIFCHLIGEWSTDGFWAKFVGDHRTDPDDYRVDCLSPVHPDVSREDCMREFARASFSTTNFGQVDCTFYVTAHGRVVRTTLARNVLLWFDVLSDDNALALLDLGNGESFVFGLVTGLQQLLFAEGHSVSAEIERQDRYRREVLERRDAIRDVVRLLG